LIVFFLFNQGSFLKHALFILVHDHLQQKLTVTELAYLTTTINSLSKPVLIDNYLLLREFSGFSITFLADSISTKLTHVEFLLIYLSYSAGGALICLSIGLHQRFTEFEERVIWFEFELLLVAANWHEELNWLVYYCSDCLFT